MKAGSGGLPLSAGRLDVLDSCGPPSPTHAVFARRGRQRTNRATGRHQQVPDSPAPLSDTCVALQNELLPPSMGTAELSPAIYSSGPTAGGTQHVPERNPPNEIALKSPSPRRSRCPEPEEWSSRWPPTFREIEWGRAPPDWGFLRYTSPRNSQLGSHSQACASSYTLHERALHGCLPHRRQPDLLTNSASTTHDERGRTGSGQTRRWQTNRPMVTASVPTGRTTKTNGPRPGLTQENSRST